MRSSPAFRQRRVARRWFGLVVALALVGNVVGIADAADGGQTPAQAERLRPGTGECAGFLESIDEVQGETYCTHGPDSLTPADALRGASPASVVAAAAAVGDLPGIPCYSSGSVVKVFYLYQKGTLNRFAQRLPYIREIVAIADAIYQESAAQKSAIRHVRWKMGPGCKLAVVPVAIKMSVSLGKAESTLRSRGLLGSTENGIAFRETGSSCYGLGELRRDDRPSTRRNLNNRGGMFSWMQLGPCLALDAGSLRMGEMAAHEIAHTLGAVQWTSPNSSRHGHCEDAYDVMCYKDAPSTRIRIVCSEMRPLLLDCGKNDYFNPRPAAGSYIAKHWNIARSKFLATAAPAAWDRLARPTVAITSPPNGSTIAGDLTIKASAAAPADAILQAVAFFVNEDQVEVDSTKPYEATISTIGQFANGTILELTAAAVDTYDRVAFSSPLSVTVNNPATTLAITTPAQGATVSGTIPVSAQVTAAPGTVIEFVEFLADGESFGGTSTAPYSADYDTMFALDGATIELVAVAYDNFGRSFPSAAVSVHISNPQPTIAITSPWDDAVVDGPFTIQANPLAPGSTILQVSFYADGSWIDSASSSPWSASVDPGQLGYAAGDPIVLTAWLEDSLGRFAESLPVTVTYQP